jgi:hypothetical protein
MDSVRSIARYVAKEIFFKDACLDTLVSVWGGDPFLIRLTSTRLCAKGGLVDQVRETTACVFFYNSIRYVVRHKFLA